MILNLLRHYPSRKIEQVPITHISEII